MQRRQTIYYIGNLAKFQKLEQQDKIHAVDYAVLIELIRQKTVYSSQQMATRVGIATEKLQPVLDRLQDYELITIKVETIHTEEK